MHQHNILIIGFVWPEPQSSAAGSRMMQLIRIFQKQQWKITFASPAQDSEFAIDLSTFDITKVGIELNSDSFDSFIADLNPTMVLFDRFMIEEQFGWRVARSCPHALRILDTEDLHCLRLARQKAFKEDRTFQLFDLLEEDTAKREIASMLRCDLSLIISEYEMEILKNNFKIEVALLHYLPLVSEINEKPWPKFDDRKDFMFIGNFLHEPNRNAVAYLKSEIWPLIRKELPQAMLHVYGAYPLQQIQQFHNVKDGFLVCGRAENAKTVIENARIMLAPLRFGAGIKGKLLEAMEYGTPSITTAVGAEAMPGDLGWNGVIADDPNEFTAAAIQLYQDEQAWKIAQQNGIQILNGRFRMPLFEADFLSKIRLIQDNLVFHRQQNFLGAMLQFHTLRSTEYLSRWIEAKNKTN